MGPSMASPSLTLQELSASALDTSAGCGSPLTAGPSALYSQPGVPITAGSLACPQPRAQEPGLQRQGKRWGEGSGWRRSLALCGLCPAPGRLQHLPAPLAGGGTEHQHSPLLFPAVVYRMPISHPVLRWVQRTRGPQADLSSHRTSWLLPRM